MNIGISNVAINKTINKWKMNLKNINYKVTLIKFLELLPCATLVHAE